MKLFKKKKSEEEHTKTTNELVEEIHENFYTEVDRLVELANHSNEVKKENEKLLDKAKRLEDNGFINTKEAIETRQLLRENEKNNKILEAIQYFQFRYPNYKFITEDSVKGICDKYGLIYGSVYRYTGDVPDKSLEHIEKFQINNEDELFIMSKRNIYGKNEKYISFKKFLKERKNLKGSCEKHGIMEDEEFCFDVLIGSGIDNITLSKAELEIAAPKDDFDLLGMKIEDNKVVEQSIPDPIVLKPVMYDGNKYYLIVTAWGQEASDEEVVNQKMN